jgi:hypothetical protein
MKLTKSQLKQLIKEELRKVLNEQMTGKEGQTIELSQSPPPRPAKRIPKEIQNIATAGLPMKEQIASVIGLAFAELQRQKKIAYAKTARVPGVTDVPIPRPAPGARVFPGGLTRSEWVEHMYKGDTWTPRSEIEHMKRGTSSRKMRKRAEAAMGNWDEDDLRQARKALATTEGRAMRIAKRLGKAAGVALTALALYELYKIFERGDCLQADANCARALGGLWISFDPFVSDVAAGAEIRQKEISRREKAGIPVHSDVRFPPGHPGG